MLIQVSFKEMQPNPNRGSSPRALVPFPPAAFVADNAVLFDVVDATGYASGHTHRALLCKDHMVFNPLAAPYHGPVPVDCQPMQCNTWAEALDWIRSTGLATFAKGFVNDASGTEAVTLVTTGKGLEEFCRAASVGPYFFNHAIPWADYPLQRWPDPKHDPKPTAVGAAPPGLVDAADFDPNDLPRRDWIMENMLHHKLMTLVVATGSSGKSTFSQQLAMAVAVGQDFGPFKLRKRCNVMLMNRENDNTEHRKRMLAACEPMGIHQGELRRSIYYYDPGPVPLVYADSEKGKRVIKEGEWVAELRLELIRNDIGVLILDPLVKFHVGLDENSNTDQEQIARAAMRIAEQCNVAVLVCHHAHKHAVPNLNASRGGIALPDASRLGFHLAKSEVRPIATLTHLKNTLGPLLPPSQWQFIGYDLPNGEQAAAMVPVDTDPATWEHRDEVLAMVAEGRGDDATPWPASRNSARDQRLDVAIEARWKLAEGAGAKVLEALVNDGLIASQPVQVPKKPKGVRTYLGWVLVAGEQVAAE